MSRKYPQNFKLIQSHSPAFRLDELVLAKIRGWSFWPASITDYKYNDFKKKYRYSVKFYGTKEKGEVFEDKIKKYEPKIPYEINSKYSKQMTIAFNEISEAYKIAEKRKLEENVHYEFFVKPKQSTIPNLINTKYNVCRDFLKTQPTVFDLVNYLAIPNCFRQKCLIQNSVYKCHKLTTSTIQDTNFLKNMFNIKKINNNNRSENVNQVNRNGECSSLVLNSRGQKSYDSYCLNNKLGKQRKCFFKDYSYHFNTFSYNFNNFLYKGLNFRKQNKSLPFIDESEQDIFKSINHNKIFIKIKLNKNSNLKKRYKLRNCTNHNRKRNYSITSPTEVCIISD